MVKLWQESIHAVVLGFSAAVIAEEDIRQRVCVKNGAFLNVLCFIFFLLVCSIGCYLICCIAIFCFFYNFLYRDLKVLVRIGFSFGR